MQQFYQQIKLNLPTAGFSVYLVMPAFYIIIGTDFLLKNRPSRRWPYAAGNLGVMHIGAHVLQPIPVGPLRRVSGTSSECAHGAQRARP